MSLKIWKPHPRTFEEFTESFWALWKPSLINNVLFFSQKAHNHPYVHTHTDTVSWRWPAPSQWARPSVALDNQTRCPRPSPWPYGICGPREREKRKGKAGRASTHGGFRKSVPDTQTRARETDSGRRRHRLSISCLWTLSAVCYVSLSPSLHIR